MLRALLAMTRFRIPLIAAFTTTLAVLLISQYRRSSWYYPSPKQPTITNYPPDLHPISILIKSGAEEWKRLLALETENLTEAASAYRKLRGRHPPPLFDQWFEYAKARNAVIVEEFFNPIYHDLNPFWALNPSELRWQTANSSHRILVREHKTTTVSDGRHVWVSAWESLIGSLQEYLPDITVPLNVMDESRLVVPWETISEYMQKEKTSRRMPEPKDVVTMYTTLPEQLNVESSFDPEFGGPAEGSSYWDMVTRGCPQYSAARTKMSNISFSAPSPGLNNYLDISYHGYVTNWTQSMDLCIRPELREIHGNFIEPISISTSSKLSPLFGGSKLSTNNEILLPAAMYWKKNTIWSGDEEDGGPWKNKSNVLMWRGAATGGRNRDENWAGFHRHRFLSAVNATAVHLAEAGEMPPNFRLPDYNLYNLPASPKLSEFLKDHVDAGFVHLVCFPSRGEDPHCPYTEPYFEITPGLPMKEQYRMKYLPDLDGNSFSGRYRPFLLSTSLPIKSSLYSEWHDSRLVPWAHFVPMDSTFMDIYGILGYFIGFNSSTGHDSAAEKIALDGKAWAERVLRREDMQIYVYRALLEYARICDDQREQLGFVGDLK